MIANLCRRAGGFLALALVALVIFGLSAWRGGAAAPQVSAVFAGPPQAMFDTRTAACEPIDIPDMPPRAFRDDRGTVHLFATHYVARAMLGPSLDRLKHDCHVVYRSPENGDPAQFADRNWLTAFHTADGRHIAALVHSEYEAWTVPGMCATPQIGWPQIANCWWNTITFAQSTDGGYDFAAPAAPKNLVAALPYRYDKGNTAGAAGYQQPSNIVRLGDFYYALIDDWPYKAQKYGPCLIRSTDPFDAKSWRAWDGSGFTAQFIDPYREPASDPQSHLCAPVMPGEVGGLVRVEGSQIFLATALTPDSRFGPPGFYLLASADLIHWSAAERIAATADLLASEPPGKWKYGFFALLDPASTDRDFSTVGQRPEAWYVRLDQLHAPLARTLFRRPLRLRFADGVPK